MQISVTINGKAKQLAIQPGDTLLEVLRREGYKSVKFSDDSGLYGCDTVLLNGKAISSQITLAAKGDGAEILTIEGLSENGKLHPLQQAFIEVAFGKTPTRTEITGADGGGITFIIERDKDEG